MQSVVVWFLIVSELVKGCYGGIFDSVMGLETDSPYNSLLPNCFGEMVHVKMTTYDHYIVGTVWYYWNRLERARLSV
jgi:hypothetical protein